MPEVNQLQHPADLQYDSTENVEKSIFKDIFNFNIKPYFEVGWRQKYRDRDEIEKLVTTSWNNDVIKFDLIIAEIKLADASIDEKDKRAKCVIKVLENTNLAHLENKELDENSELCFDVYKSLFAKDMAFMSDNGYHLFRTLLNLDVACLNKVKKFRSKLNKKFGAIRNSKGYYLNAERKLEFVLRYFIKKNDIPENFKFKIKLCADGTNLNKKHLSLFNVAFTIINEGKKAKTSWGNYILGKFKKNVNVF